MDLGEGLNMENRVVSQLFFYALILPSNLRLDSVYGIKKPEPNDSGKPSREEYRIIDPKYTPDWNKLKSILIF